MLHPNVKVEAMWTRCQGVEGRRYSTLEYRNERRLRKKAM
jgi:hypothetical protein